MQPKAVTSPCKCRVMLEKKGGTKMTIKEWNELKHGDKIKHENGDVETIYVWNGEKYIEGKKSLFPLAEFDHNEWTKL